MQNALHDLIAHLFHCTAGEFCKRPTAEPLKHPAQESDDEYKPKVTKGFFFWSWVNQPFELFNGANNDTHAVNKPNKKIFALFCLKWSLTVAFTTISLFLSFFDAFTISQEIDWLSILQWNPYFLQ